LPKPLAEPPFLKQQCLLANAFVETQHRTTASRAVFMGRGSVEMITLKPPTIPIHLFIFCIAISVRSWFGSMSVHGCRHRMPDRSRRSEVDDAVLHDAGSEVLQSDTAARWRVCSCSPGQAPFRYRYWRSFVNCQS
jgi:hypothetical protein